MPRLLLAAGGTGGHMFPAQALAEHLRIAGWDIAMMTDARGSKHAGNIPADPIIEISAASISLRKPVNAIKGLIKLNKGVRQAKHFIKDWRPDIIVGFGGYPAFPALRAAQSLGLPTVLHEQNAVLGRVNRVFAKKATIVVSGFDVLKRLPKGAQHKCLGNPLRQQIIKSIPKVYETPRETLNLLIVGGSLGARILSKILPVALSSLSEDLRTRLNVVQQVTKDEVEIARNTYKSANISAICEPFFSDIERHLAKAHYVIGRAGASSVSEIAAMGKPSLLIPLAIAMDDHQTMNAKSLERLDAADILPESEFTPERAKLILEDRLNDTDWLKSASASASKAGRLNAGSDLATLVSELVSG